MLNKFLYETDVFQIFKVLAFIGCSLVGLCILAAVVYFSEPKEDLGLHKLEVVSASWHQRANRNGGSHPIFRAIVILPNGNQHTFRTYPNRIMDEGLLCTNVELGMWTDAHHVKILTAENCSE